MQSESHNNCCVTQWRASSSAYYVYKLTPNNKEIGLMNLAIAFILLFIVLIVSGIVLYLVFSMLISFMEYSERNK